MLNGLSDRAKKRKLLRRVRRQRLKYITILPSLITLLNGACGFAAIGFASKIGTEPMSFRNLEHSNFAWAGYMIFIAMIADMLDGRVARMSHTTSSFGGQLDSLCDMISFGVAPAFLVQKLLFFQIRDFVHPSIIVEPFLIKFIWISSALYWACAAIRLARFNVENEEDETSHMTFIGLPTPGAAGVLASLVIFYEYLLESGSNPVIEAIGIVLLTIMPFLSIFLAIVMISRIRYPHVVNHYLKGRKPIEHLVWIIVVLGLIYWSVETGLVICFTWYAFSGFVYWLYMKIRHKAGLERPAEPPVLAVTHNGGGDFED